MVLIPTLCDKNLHPIENELSLLYIKWLSSGKENIVVLNHSEKRKDNDLNVDFLNQSSNATMYSWDFGNGGLLDYSDPDNPSLSSIYEIEGIYYVELIAQNDLCSDTFGIEINALLLGDPIIFVPNVFSPNQDGTNELFIIETENIATLELIILNRWGNVMARIESLDDGWDGKSFSGNEAEEGVYFYKYSAQGNNGTELSGHGFLTLVR